MQHFGSNYCDNAIFWIKILRFGRPVSVYARPDPPFPRPPYAVIHVGSPPPPTFDRTSLMDDLISCLNLCVGYNRLKIQS